MSRVLSSSSAQSVSKADIFGCLPHLRVWARSVADGSRRLKRNVRKHFHPMSVFEMARLCCMPADAAIKSKMVSVTEKRGTEESAEAEIEEWRTRAYD